MLWVYMAEPGLYLAGVNLLLFGKNRKTIFIKKNRFQDVLLIRLVLSFFLQRYPPKKPCTKHKRRILDL